MCGRRRKGSGYSQSGEGSRPQSASASHEELKLPGGGAGTGVRNSPRYLRGTGKQVIIFEMEASCTSELWREGAETEGREQGKEAEKESGGRRRQERHVMNKIYGVLICPSQNFHTCHFLRHNKTCDGSGSYSQSCLVLHILSDHQMSRRSWDNTATFWK